MTFAFLALATLLATALATVPGAQNRGTAGSNANRNVASQAHPETSARASYAGRWEFAGGHARSFRVGDAATYVYNGERLRVYGTVGPQGGTGTVILPDYSPVTIDFFAPLRKTHQLLYTSPAGAPAVHSLSIVVSKTRHGAHGRGYVNLEAAIVTGAR